MSEPSRVVVVTGGASGIGLGITQLLAQQYPVAVLDLQEELLQTHCAQLKAQGAKVVGCQADVTQRHTLDAAYATIREQLGPIGMVVANAGTSCGQDFATMTAEQWSTMLNVNLTGVFHTIQAALPDMIAQNWGRIVTISSHAGQTGASDRAHYAAAKAGVIGLTKALARELAPHKITANTIPPSLVDTPLARRGLGEGKLPPMEVIVQHLPAGRAGTPEDIAYACAFLCSDQASYITGQSIDVNGGAYI